MPITGIPDRDRHRFCIKCHQWCEPHEGCEVSLDGLGVRDAMRDAAGIERNTRFMCDACSRRARRLWWSLIGVLGAAVIVVVTLKALGIIQ